MSRSPNALGIIDIRTAAILQDVVLAANPCAPGAAKSKRMYHLYGEPLSEIMAGRRKKFDGPRDWIAALSSMVIIATIIGIVQSFGIFIGHASISYNVPLADVIMTGALSYGMLIAATPLASFLIRYMGIRLTCLFGLLLFFIGLILISLVIHRTLFVVAYILLIGGGGSLAYTAAVSSVVDRFRKSLPIAVLLLTIAPPLGTAFYFAMLNQIFIHLKHIFVYQWTLLILALIILLVSLTTFIFPARVGQRHANPFRPKQKTRRNKVKNCIEKSVRKTAATCLPPATTPQELEDKQSCLCVVVIDISILSDLSFLLWAAITFLVMMSTFIPYLFLLNFTQAKNIQADPPELVIYMYCLGSILGRVGTMVKVDFTFLYNRTLFQVAVIASGFAYISFIWADTVGWILFWSLCAGCLEGILTTVMPRVTMQTIPRPWMSSSWAYIVIINGLGLIAGVAVVLCTSIISKGHTLGLVTIGVAQIFAGLLAFLLANEEPEDDDETNAMPQPLTYTRRFANTYPDSQNMYRGKSSFSNRRSGLYKESFFGATNTCLGGTLTQSYTTSCPICSKVGCIPGCCPCTPGGLVSTMPLSTSNNTMNFDIQQTTNYNLPSFGREKSPNMNLNSTLDSSGAGPSRPIASVPPSLATASSSPTTKGNMEGTVKRINLEIRHNSITSASPPVPQSQTNSSKDNSSKLPVKKK